MDSSSEDKVGGSVLTKYHSNKCRKEMKANMTLKTARSQCFPSPILSHFPSPQSETQRPTDSERYRPWRPLWSSDIAY